MKSRPVQTRVKHEILEEYLNAWGGIILHGLSHSYKRSVRENWGTFSSTLVYVDCFAFEGLYLEDNQIVEGSPFIGIRALDQLAEHAKLEWGFAPSTKVVLIEETPETYQTLVNNLTDRGFADRLVHSIEDLQSGQIAVLNGDYQQYSQSLLELTGHEYTWAFYLLDPYGAKGLPLELVGAISSQAGNDVMINFSIYAIYMKTGSALQHTPEHAKHIQYISDLFGMDDWFHAAEFLEGEKLEQALADQYRQVLQRIDPTLAIKHIPLRFEGIDKTAYYLFLTTHDGTGGLAMNRILDKGLASEFEHRQQHRLTKSEIKSGNLLMTDLLMQAESSEQPEIDEADIPSVAEEIYSICAGREMPYREVLREMVNSPYYRKDVRQAMTYLKRAGRVDYGSPLRNKDTVKFS